MRRALICLFIFMIPFFSIAQESASPETFFNDLINILSQDSTADSVKAPVIKPEEIAPLPAPTPDLPVPKPDPLPA
ncbi:MAG: hypothetical protein KAT14_00855, partial [Candidatus Marinimicrobia bacterium]|nr:hypothetical protein [Candidatus Neomarinimicrobiota bacterium]